MVTGSHRVFVCAANFLRGRKCVFCGSFRVNRTRRGYITCRSCRRQKSLAKLRRKIAILQGFYQQVPAYRLAHDLGVDPKVISRVYQKLRTALFHVAELEGMASSVLTNCLESLDLSHLALLQTSSESLAGCSERPSSKPQRVKRRIVVR